MVAMAVVREVRCVLYDCSTDCEYGHERWSGGGHACTGGFVFFGAHVGSGAYIRVVPARAKPPEVLVAVRAAELLARASARPALSQGRLLLKEDVLVEVRGCPD
jgi:hypothetical protein